MKIDVKNIPDHGLTVDARREAHTLPGLLKVATEERIEFLTPLDIHLMIHSEKDMIKVRGRLNFTLNMICSRCLDAFESRVAPNFNLRFSKRIPEDVHFDRDENVELTAEQIGLIFYSDDEIDVTDAIREQVILSLPYRRLCASDCKGICQVCGANLNKEICQCGQSKAPGPFDILKTLK